MPNQFDSRHRSAFDIVADLRSKYKSLLKLAVLGTHRVDASALAEALPPAIAGIVEQEIARNKMAPTERVLILTGCADGGTEKAARLAAKTLTGRRAVVFHRAELVYGPKAAEKMRDGLLAQEAHALVLVSTGKGVCKHARFLFGARSKKVYEIEI